MRVASRHERHRRVGSIAPPYGWSSHPVPGGRQAGKTGARLNSGEAWGIYPHMRNHLFAAAVAASFLVPHPAAAQVSVTLRLDLPVVLPALVIVEPGVQVVPGVNEEVFFVDGYYWVRRDTRWYRSHDHRSGWVVVESRGVPPRLVKIPPGHYRKWHPQEKQEKRDRGDQGDHEKQGKEKRGHGKD